MGDPITIFFQDVSLKGNPKRLADLMAALYRYLKSSFDVQDDDIRYEMDPDADKPNVIEIDMGDRHIENATILCDALSKHIKNETGMIYSFELV